MIHPTEWEYLTLIERDDTDLNALGAEGWELTGVSGMKLYFKRPATSFRERVTLDQKRHYYGMLGVQLADQEGQNA
jgi:hypothetical protein